jgi:autotransporter passenger strand-loop-strand repeat protein
MSVTYYYDTANGLTSASTSTTSGMTVVTDQVMVVTSGSTVSAATLLVSSVDLTGSGTAAANPAGATLTYNGGFVVATVSGVSETLDAGTAIVQSGGAIVSSTIEFGGAIFVEGGVTSSTINSGGVELVFSGGLASGSVTSAGTQAVYAGGTVSGTTTDGGAFQEIYSGGTAVGVYVDGQGTQDIFSGAIASGTTLYVGSTQTVHAGGEVYLNNQIGGNAYIYGVTSQSTVSSGGIETVMSGGSAQASWVSGGGTQVVSAGGVATGAYVVNIATQEIDVGGKAIGTTVSGGTVNVQGGTLANTYLSTAGGQINVASGGVATGTVAAAGLIEIKAGGVTSGTSLIGGQEIVMNGGSATGTNVGANGSEVVLSGGTATGTFLQAGGSVTVYDGGNVSGLLATGGVISLSGKATTGDIVLAGSGVEVQFLGTSVAASGNVKISGLAAGDTIDLANISGGASASYSAANGGELVITNASGAVLATIEIGTPGGLFTVGTDTGTGTLVTVVPSIETAAAAAASYQAGTLYTGVTVTDSAADIGANLNALESIYTAGKLTGVTLTDSGIAALSVTTVQLAADVNVLNGITGSLVVSVDASTATNAAIVGLSNHATVVDFSGTASQYTITTSGTGTFTVAGSAIGTDTLNGVTALKFSDVTEIVATANHVGTVLSSLNIAELYSAALNRAPDVAGLSYYETLIKSTPAITGLTVAEYFLSSPEYKAAHSYAQTAAGDSQFVSDLYTNILHRTGSAAEISYYTTIISQYTTGLTTGTAAYSQAELQAHAQVLDYFSASAEFLSDIQITAAHPASSSHWLLVV